MPRPETYRSSPAESPAGVSITCFGDAPGVPRRSLRDPRQTGPDHRFLGGRDSVSLGLVQDCGHDIGCPIRGGGRCEEWWRPRSVRRSRRRRPTSPRRTDTPDRSAPADAAALPPPRPHIPPSTRASEAPLYGPAAHRTHPLGHGAAGTRPPQAPVGPAGDMRDQPVAVQHFQRDRHVRTRGLERPAGNAVAV